MSLDEAIKYCQEVAEEKEKKACNLYDAKNYEESRECIWCSAEHKQFAEWLKELKQLREQEPFMNKPCVTHQVCHDDKVKVLDKIRAEIEALEEGITSYHNDKPWIFKDEALEIIDKYRTESKKT